MSQISDNRETSAVSHTDVSDVNVRDDTEMNRGTAIFGDLPTKDNNAQGALIEELKVEKADSSPTIKL
jgi:hypothetical protein